MWVILQWVFKQGKEQEKESHNAKLHELKVPPIPYAERPADHPQYCGEAAVEYGSQSVHWSISDKPLA